MPRFLARGLCLLALAGALTSSVAVSAPARVPGGTPTSTAYRWPLPPPATVVRPFDLPAPYGPGHRGVDLVAEVGQEVHAAGDALVVYAGWLVDRNLVSLEHPDGLRTTYEPVSPLVEVGQQVSAGAPIGRVEPGHPECAASPDKTCLHWGARRRLQYLDPLRLLGHGRVRLMPWDGLDSA